ncbi:MAG TPA: starch-binding protein [Paludibacter sp.]|nr:starch-binding protein [Paludibacter sp.]
MKKTLLLLSIGAFFSFNTIAQVTYSVTVPAGTNTCYISGDMNAWAFAEMTKIDDTHYTITIAGATTSQGYKYLSGPSWSYEERYANGSGRGNRTYAASDVVEKWLAVYVPTAPKINITVKARTPWTLTNVHFWGDLESTWPGVPMTQVGDYWQYTFNNVTIMNVIFNNGAGNQTGDILTISANTCFIVNADASYTITDCTTFTSMETPEKPAVFISSENSRLSVQLEGDANISVYTMQGALVKQSNFRNNYTIDHLNSGLYLLNINGKSYKALVK